MMMIMTVATIHSLSIHKSKTSVMLHMQSFLSNNIFKAGLLPSSIKEKTKV